MHVTIKTQIDNINNTHKYMNECLQNSDKIKQEMESLESFWESDKQFHKELEIYGKMAIFKRNIATFLDELKYFLNVNAQIEKMKQMFHEENYEYIHYKLMALIELRDNVLTKLQNSPELEVIKQEFEQLGEFERKFYDLIFG